MANHDDTRLKCSFCGKTQDQVKKLIAGPEVYICDECVELCNEILDEEFLDTINHTVFECFSRSHDVISVCIFFDF